MAEAKVIQAEATEATVLQHKNTSPVLNLDLNHDSASLQFVHVFPLHDDNLERLSNAFIDLKLLQRVFYSLLVRSKEITQNIMASEMLSHEEKLEFQNLKYAIEQTLSSFAVMWTKSLVSGDDLTFFALSQLIIPWKMRLLGTIRNIKREFPGRITNNGRFHALEAKMNTASIVLTHIGDCCGLFQLEGARVSGYNTMINVFQESCLQCLTKNRKLCNTPNICVLQNINEWSRKLSYSKRTLKSYFK